MCVQRRLVCSAGVSPVRVIIRSPVAWIAEWRESKALKPIDEAFLGKAASHQAVTRVNTEMTPKVSGPEGRARNRRAKAAWLAEM